MSQFMRLAPRRLLTTAVLALSFTLHHAASAQQYGAPERFTPATPFQGVHGLAIDAQGRLLAGSVTGASLYEVDRQSGKVSTLIGPLDGQADDIAIGPEGRMAWTAFTQGRLLQRQGNGPVQELAKDLPGINSVAYDKNGRLFATQVFMGDALWEFDPAGQKPPRKIIENMGGLNGFEIGEDGWLYGPLWFKGQVVRVNVDTGELQVVADGFKVPAAANFDSKGNLYVLDTNTGEVIRVDPKSGAKSKVAQLPPALDNLAVDKRTDTLYVSNMADNAIHEVNPTTGAVRTIVRSDLAAPGGIDMQGNTLYVADIFAFRNVNAQNAKVAEGKRMMASDLEYPMNVSVNAKNALLSSWFTNSVQVVDRQTSETRDMMHEFKTPMDAVELRDGTVLVAELGTGSLLRVSGEHGKNREAVVTGLQGPSDLVLSQDGKTLYVVESMGGRVSAVDTGNWSKREVASGLKLPESAAVTPNGRLIVLEQEAKRLVEIDPATGASTVVAENLPVGAKAIPGFPPTYLVNGVAVNPAGDVFFTSDIDGSIYRVPRQKP